MSESKDVHGRTVKWIGRYLAGTNDQGIIMKPDKNKGFEVYIDASFVGDWDTETAHWDSDTAKSRMGYVFMFAGCPILCTLRVQSEVALSTTESEYIAISLATRVVLPLVIKLMDELQDKGVIEQSV